MSSTNRSYRYNYQERQYNVKNQVGLGTAIKTGFGMNIGNKLADWLFGSSTVETKVIQTIKPYDCSKFTELLEKCMQTPNSDCSTFLESLKQCQKN
jgi:hypothetical protein